MTPPAHPGPHEHGHEGHEGHGGHGGHGHDARHRGGPIDWLRGLVVPHSHDAAVTVDSELETSSRGLRTLFWSFLVLLGTAALQAVVVAFSGSVALLGDTLHNVADALTAVPLALAFTVGRRAPTRRYTYGFGRAEDLAGVVIVVLIAFSAAAAAYEAVGRLVTPAPVHHLGAVAGAAVVGFLGNEAVARYRIRVGRDIGSAALVADGLHARTDGFTSLAVLLGAGGAGLGWRWADPAVGLVITVAIVAVLRDAVREVYRRLMDAVDPALLDRVEVTLRATPGVIDLGETRLRWIGHALRAECEIVVGADLTVAAAHEIAENARHRLLHDIPRLTTAIVHADPHDPQGRAHAGLAHHDPHPH
jgi:cation diffusion facilitator family transporter